MTIRGIDVSVWQGQINWAAVANDGVRFAFVRASHGLSADSRGAENMAGARGTIERVGAYHYLEKSHDAADQAGAFLRFYARADGDLPPVLDLEEGGSDSAARALTWLAIVEEAIDVRPMVYTSAGFADRVGLVKRVELADYPLWVAHWTHAPEPTLPAPWQSWAIWQHASNGRVAGINGSVDLDVAPTLDF